jgi:hypothetical protein
MAGGSLKEARFILGVIAGEELGRSGKMTAPVRRRQDGGEQLRVVRR